MTACGCRMTGNQHGSVFRACDRHAALIEHACRIAEITPEEFLERAVTAYLDPYLEGRNGLRRPRH